MSNKMLIQGRTGPEKTALIEGLLQMTEPRPRGFYTSELTEGEKRAGYNLHMINGPMFNYAHVNFNCRQRVGKFGVDLKLFEEFAIPEITEAIESNSPLLIDEIGRMALLSIRFKRTLLKALDADLPIVAFINSRPHPFIDQIRQRPGVECHRMTEDNEIDVIAEALQTLAPTATVPDETAIETAAEVSAEVSEDLAAVEESAEPGGE